jgi:hypothetical protein
VTPQAIVIIDYPSHVNLETPKPFANGDVSTAPEE